MITGMVQGNAATIHLAIKDANGREHEIEAIVDTGFSGSLTLPPAMIRRLGLPWRTRGTAVLANGAVEQFDIYATIVIWDGMPRNVLVDEADIEPLVGMALLRGYDLSIRVIDGGGVTIASIP